MGMMYWIGGVSPPLRIRFCVERGWWWGYRELNEKCLGFRGESPLGFVVVRSFSQPLCGIKIYCTHRLVPIDFTVPIDIEAFIFTSLVEPNHFGLGA
ncbi:hypothetical protein CEXT_796361 [Caerostris extrusa]|uniref:Uncharacterized protein n=1 Tax=Caerostris extrusa TaxID=172846 RepID=A0AAV4TIL8_CAEEX|nr:hypothetical protein CEXT_796361 [Caerostris extrusa]